MHAFTLSAFKHICMRLALFAKAASPHSPKCKDLEPKKECPSSKHTAQTSSQVKLLWDRPNKSLLFVAHIIHFIVETYSLILELAVGQNNVDKQALDLQQ